MLNIFLDMTVRNPIFMLVVFTIIWFLPGMVVRRLAEKRSNNQKAQKQAEAIDKLYPKERNTSV